MISVLIVDDSAVVRSVLEKALQAAEGITVVGTAADPYIAREKIIKLKPDVMTLDIEMPRMDGLTFLKKIMTHYPIPTIIVSSLTPKNAAMAMEALDLGAMDVLCKPGSAYTIEEVIPTLIEQIKASAVSKNFHINRISKVSAIQKPVRHSLIETTNKIIAIGASTGGTNAISDVLTSMPANAPGIVIVQHMPAEFTKSFAERLNELCAIEVREAKPKDRIVQGTALIAPGNYHMMVNRSGAQYYVDLNQGPRIHYQRPAVEVLFASVAQYVGANAIGIILTGMGSDGAVGLKKIKDSGGYTIIQNRETSVVYGMPGAAEKVNAGSIILPLNKITAHTMAHLS
ncbi:MAG: chemotaxis response regulator protein-glutamate methylesterase [Fibrobacterales bacterium]